MKLITLHVSRGGGGGSTPLRAGSSYLGGGVRPPLRKSWIELPGGGGLGGSSNSSSNLSPHTVIPSCVPLRISISRVLRICIHITDYIVQHILESYSVSLLTLTYHSFPWTL